MTIPPATILADPSNQAIRLRGVHKSFGKGKTVVHALRGVDLDVDANQLVMLVGPSGCGKTTLISVISGVLDADRGSIDVFGTDWSALSPGAKARKRSEMVGFVFQQFNLIPTLTVQQNVAVPLLLGGGSYADAMKRAAEALHWVNLGDRVLSLPSQLSGGQQQRVAIARALVTHPRLLVCDEPTANLDGRTGQRIMDLIRALSRPDEKDERARCVIVVTHDARIFHYADRIIEMEDGRLKDKPSGHVLEESRHVPHYDHHHGRPPTTG